VRLDGAPVIAEDGRITVRFSRGEPDLGAAPDGLALVFPSLSDLVRAINAMTATLTYEELLLLGLAAWLAADPQGTTPEAIAGKVITLDVANPTGTIGAA
jgi:hypothetical protein